MGPQRRSVWSAHRVGLGFFVIVALMAALVTQAMPGRAQAATAGNGMVRVVHASPDAPAVDLYLDGKVAVQGLGFGKATDFAKVTAGDHELKVVPAGGDVGKAVVTQRVTVNGNRSYDLVVHGMLAKVRIEAFKVDTSPIAKGKARLRVIHESADAGDVDIAVKGGAVLFAKVKYTAASTYKEVATGTVDLEVRPAGKTDVALTLSGVQLEAGKVYEVFAIGRVTDKSLAALVLAVPVANG